ncbi:MAG TPA: trypsin-like peptidase domain-containing protein, partial [Chloroflexota bacterium]|nr:trypsin-like peptidase domain-containing protein [Chloroflexota bacterium]
MPKCVLMLRTSLLLAALAIATLPVTACNLKLPPAENSKPEARVLQPEPTREAAAAPTALPTRPAFADPATQAAPKEPTQTPAAVQVASSIAPQPGAGLSVVQVSARVRPAVAQIMVKGTTLSLFDPVPTSGVGSGAVIDKKGYIITNNHVVEDATDIVVSLPEREKTYTGHLVGRDPSTDLAVIQIEADNLPTVGLGDSDSLQIGEPVVAIGNALGLEGGPTVTSGVVSALNRSIDEPSGATLNQLIQTDAAINPGNSGGPLVNLSGQVIGVNTAVATGSSDAPAQGIGFAISINSAKPIIDDLIAYGKVRRPYLGVELATVTPSLARQYRLAVDRGVYIVRTVAGSPAAKAGITAGDIVTKIDSDDIRTVADLRKSIAKAKIGQKIKIQVARGSSQR